MKYWIIVASKNHVEKGIKGGFAQACHGKSSPLKRMKKDDWIIYYSPQKIFTKEKIKDNSCKEFTAIGQVKDDKVYPFQMTENFCPSRIDINYYKSNDVSIIPLINELNFIENKKNWGYKFRFGILEINKADFELIKSFLLVA
ncbi:MAG: EVE domain-containing protein [Candidatus Sericytochromatia bacterium]